MGEFSPWHLLIVAVVFVALFGAKRLPDMARGVGQSLRILRSELRGETKPDQAADPAERQQRPEP